MLLPLSLSKYRHIHLIKPKGLSLGLGFQFFEYWVLGLGLGILQIFCKFHIRLFKIKKKCFNFFFISNNLIRNLQKDLQNTQTQNPTTQKTENPNPDLNPCALLGAYVCPNKPFLHASPC